MLYATGMRSCQDGVEKNKRRRLEQATLGMALQCGSDAKRHAENDSDQAEDAVVEALM